MGVIIPRRFDGWDGWHGGVLSMRAPIVTGGTRVAMCKCKVNVVPGRVAHSISGPFYIAIGDARRARDMTGTLVSCQKSKDKNVQIVRRSR